MDPARWRRRQRRHAWLMSVFSLLTLGVLVFIAGLVVRLGRMPTTETVAPAGLSRSTTARTVLADSSAGLSYELLGSPWRAGCPRELTTASFRWTAGEGATAGLVRADGHRVTWYANACSGLLPRGFRGASLKREAADAATGIGSLYYSVLRHTSTTTTSVAMLVGGRPGWLVEFQVRYLGQHLPWTSELAAVAVVSRAAGQPPALFYAAVPSNLGSADVPQLISSLR
jgi:hypothetical protein